MRLRGLIFLGMIALLLTVGCKKEPTTNQNQLEGRTALQMAVKRGHKDAVDLLIAEGADVNLTDLEGNTCLHLAAIAGQTTIAEMLISRTENINARNDRGYTPLHCAILNTYASHRDPLVMLLIAKGADVNARSNSGWTALHFAARDDSVRAAELLIANGAEVDTTIGGGFTPLHTALRRQRYNVAEVLILNGADTNAKNADGKCPLDYVSADHRANLVALIEGRNNSAAASVEADTSITVSAKTAEAQTTDEPKTNLEKLVQANTAFALDLYGKLRSQKGNLAFSPYSISTALAMTYAAARGNTAEEMAKTLRFPLSQDDLHPAFGQLQNSLNEVQQAGNVRLHNANSLWPQSGEPLLTDYLTLAKQHYGVSITPVDYRTAEAREATRKTINRWIENKTEDRIRDLLQPDSLAELTRLILVNAIYFKGRWEKEFDPTLTQSSPFFLTTRQCVDVPMMSQEKGFRYAESESLQILELPYRGGELSMLVLLSKRIEGLDQLEASLSTEQLAQWRTSLQKDRVKIFIPKFTINFSVILKDTLRAMGMNDAFMYPGANFAGFDGDPDGFYIGEVIHKAFIEVNEEGTEAAAATAVGFLGGGPSLPLVFRADHPFLFLIQENRTGSILFIGRVTNPTSAVEPTGQRTK